jgi:pyridinium-3,5-bisthiocarboxylic acid mononucleotide nickel chelatase
MYVDAFSGASGDMLLGALLDAGLPEAALREVLERLPVTGYALEVRREKRMGLAATRAEVKLESQDHHHDHDLGHEHDHGHSHEHGHEHEHGHAHGHEHGHGAHGGHGHHRDQPARRLPDIEAIIDGADLPGRAGEWSRAIFHRLAEAEAKAHGTTPDQVHFHEVGAVDSIVDILGVASGIALLGVDRIVSSPLPMGSGFVDCAHGRLPVPAPAVVELMRGFPTRESSETGELTTPTGAVILTTLAESFGPMPPMVVSATGYGAGGRQGERTPNLVRVILGRPVEAAPAATADSVWQLEANLDDTSGETLGAAAAAILAAGALDVWLVPVTMKKGRPAIILGCLVEDASAATVEETIFRQTPTFGLRRWRVERTKLQREHVSVETPFGPVRIKLGRRGGHIVAASPEYDDCLRQADARGVAFRDVYEAARLAWAAHKP